MLELVVREWQARARAIQLKQVRFTRTLSKDCCVRQKHSRVGRLVAALVVVEELRRTARDVVDDQVRHDFDVLSQRPYVVPRAQPRIDLSVIDGIEPCIGAIDWMKEREQMHAAEHSF